MSADRTSLLFAEAGVATAYVSVPPGTFAAEEVLIQAALDRFRAGQQARRHRTDLSDVRLAYLLGQADILLQLRLTNFRSVLELEYPALESGARVFNWVFSVPYTLETPSIQDESTMGGAFFAVHLRVRRGLYAHHPVKREAQIIPSIATLLSAKNFKISVEAGLGWSDFIVHGFVAWEDFPSLRDSLLALYGCHYQTTAPRRFPIFERTLTVLGYDGNDVPPLCGLEPIILARAVPSRLHEAAAKLRTTFAIPADKIRMMDGKSDLVAGPWSAAENFLPSHQSLVGSSDAYEVLHRLETHLVTFPADEPVGSAIAPPIGSISDSEVLEKCPCSQVLDLIASFGPADLDSEQKRWVELPGELNVAIRNVQFLFKATLGDRTNCCDVSAAIIACESGLRRLLDAYRTLRLAARKTDLDDVSLAGLHRRTGDQQKLVELWCLLSERILRQRTIGSFEEILGQTDRAVSYRGGVQKFLFVADALMNDFGAIVTSALLSAKHATRHSLSPVIPRFASLYDSVSSINSMRGTGLVRIPVKHLFKLPFVIPDLWHEVATYFFFLRFPLHKILPTANPRDPATQEKYHQLADHYADLLVYLCGFRGKFFPFLLSLIRGSFDALPPRSTPLAIRRRQYEHLLLRLYLVDEFSSWRTDGDSAALAATAGRVRASVEALDAMIRSKFADKIPTAGTEVDSVVAAAMTVAFSEEQRILIRDLYECKMPTLETITREETLEGRLVGFDETTDMNGTLSAVYAHHEYQRLLLHSRENLFSAMAGLGRSIYLEYERRQTMNIREPAWLRKIFPVP